MKFLLLVALVTTLVSCGPPLDQEGNLGGEEFVGRFHGLDVFRVVTPRGVALYIGVKGGEAQRFTQHRVTQSKGGSTDYPLLVMDGEE